ncbi:MAG: hypothetical protein QW587_06180 [Candidatus Bathyarchaeia archaeon]
MNDESGFLFDRWIRWPDGAREHVQVASGGFFYLDGVRGALVGFDLGTTGLPRAFWDKTDLEILGRELSYLESIGVRLIALDLFYVGKNREQELYTPILDMLLRHKMLVFPALIGKGLPGFATSGTGSSTANFVIKLEGCREDTMGDWVHRWLDVVTGYRNVVAISVENELDVPPEGSSYSAVGLIEYLRWLFRTVREKTSLPLTSKLTAETNVRLDVKRAVLSLVDFPAVDLYAYDSAALEQKLDRVALFLAASGHPSRGWWVAELNGKTEPDPALTWRMDASKLTAAYIDSAFEHGAGVIILYPMNCVQQPAAALFDAHGMPTETLLALASILHSRPSMRPLPAAWESPS